MLRASEFSHTLLFATIQSAHQEVSTENFNVSLERLLQHTPLWLLALEWVFGKSTYHQSSPLSLCCNAVRSIIEAGVQELQSGNVPLRKCHIMLADDGRNISRLATCLHLKSAISSDSIQNTQQMMTQFDSRLQALNCFLSVYCNCGDIEIDTGEVMGLSQYLTGKYDELALLDVVGVFDGIPCMQYMQWLYELRGSILFLQLWRQQLQRVNSPDNQAQTDMDAEQTAHMRQLQQALDQAQADGNEAQAQALHQALMDLMQQRMAQQEQAEMMQPDAITIQLDMMQSVVIPAAQAEWASLMSVVKNMTIPVTTVATLFGDLNQEESQQELRLLAATGNTSGSEVGSSWHKQAQSALNEYLHLSQLRVWFPGTSCCLMQSFQFLVCRCHAGCNCSAKTPFHICRL